MTFDAERAFALLKEIGYVRVSGSAEEKRAADTLLETVKADGVKAWLEPFPVAGGTVKQAALEVLEPYRASYAVTGYLRSLSAAGLEGDFLYGEGLADTTLQRAKDKFVLINGRLGYDQLEKLQKAGVRGVLTWSGAIFDDPEETDLEIRALRPLLTEAFGKTAAVNMRASSALDMVRRGAQRVRVTVESEDTEKTSYNVCAEIPGTELPEEVVLLGAHYDSVDFSTGVYDNGSGAVIVMELLHWFAAHPPKRTLRFVWYGSEEQGLCGSHFDVAKGELDPVQLMINVDVAGPILGEENALITGSEALMTYVDAMMKEAGLAVKVFRELDSSDCVPYADRGVPCVNFGRFGAPGGAYMHERRDVIDFLSPDALASTLRVVSLFAERVIQASVFPVKREMPEDMADKIARYLKKKKD